MRMLAKACFIALAMLLLVTPLLACGGAEAPPPSEPEPTPTPSGNQPPVVTSLTPGATILLPEAVTKITCVASDPDGDALTYTWTADGGTISNTEGIASWRAPGFTGEFVIGVIVKDGEGASVSKSCTITVTTNQRPVVSSIIAEPATLERGETSKITCVASDPDGDTLTYTWEATGGTITGTENIATWEAPSVGGEFVISVSVNDGKGGVTESSCRIVVQIPEVTVILTPLPDESGSIYYDGEKITSFRIGDNDSNVGVRPYFSFDITELTDAEIKEAKLTFPVKETVENPWFVPPTLYVDDVEYGPRALQAADFHLEAIIQLDEFSSRPPGEVDAYLGITRALRPPVKPRYQVRLRLATNNNLDSQEDYIEFTTAELAVTYVK